MFSCEQALALILDLKLSKQAYMYLQKSAEKIGANIYPHYKLKKEKENVYQISL